jgi:hypothetical protein
MPWYVSDAGMNAMGGHLSATSLMTTVTASTTANAVGNWIALHAAVPFPVSGVDLFMGKTSWAVAATSTMALFDLGFGVSPSEVAIAQNIAFGGSVPFVSWTLPIYIPVASRVVMRIRSSIASKASTFAVRLYGGGMGVEGGHQAITYGAVTASSTGTVLGLPVSANTKPTTWTTITAATTAPMRWLLVGISAPPTTLATAADGLMDIGVGSAAAEAAVVPDIPFSISANEEVNGAMPLMFPVNIPAGARLSARYQSTGITAASQPNITLTGFS